MMTGRDPCANDSDHTAPSNFINANIAMGEDNTFADSANLSVFLLKNEYPDDTSRLPQTLGP